MASLVSPSDDVAAERDRLLQDIQDRVLWLAMQIVHHANHERPNPDGSKVGGHQASSSSVVTILTSLYFDYMRSGDRISVKPHASPVYHAIQYLLGNLPPEYLTQLRAFHGLQAYPSRTKDPDGVDFSTGSVGLGAVAPNFAALVEHYNRTHFESPSGDRRRYISLVGDAELDEGSVWEAIAEPGISRSGQTLWVVDLNRQSLDRIIHGIRVRAWREMFAANGWAVVDAKYGKQLQKAFEAPNGELLRMAIDEMSNDVYQRLLRLSADELREWLPRSSRHPKDLARFIDRWEDRTLQDLFRNLGGHDFSALREAYGKVGGNAPGVVFAYTLKGWRLPSVGDPFNHAATLTVEQMAQLREALNIPDEDDWPRFDGDSAGGRMCRQIRDRIASRLEPAEMPRDPIPKAFGRAYTGSLSTQQTFGMVLTALSRHGSDFVDRIVTVSPDVASSTNLGGWINKMEVWAESESEELPEEGVVRALKWKESPRGQHIELGISENNLFMMLGQLGLSYEMHGEMLLPIGTVYDPFISRGLDAFIYSAYSGARFMVVGTPAGITLAPEGGAHQSVMTPSIGIAFPGLAYYEPCFGQELEWIMLAGLEDILRRRRSVYLRLNTKRIDQELFPFPDTNEARARLRAQVLGGAYRLVDRSLEPGYVPGRNVVSVAASGAMVSEAVEAGEVLGREGIFANVVNVTGPGVLYARFQKYTAPESGGEPGAFMTETIPMTDREAPVVTVIDGHPSALAWIGGAVNAPVLPLGVTEFGQSGSRADLYGEFGIDPTGIAKACRHALGM